MNCGPDIFCLKCQAPEMITNRHVLLAEHMMWHRTLVVGVSAHSTEDALERAHNLIHDHDHPFRRRTADPRGER